MSFLGFIYVLIIAGIFAGIAALLASAINENFRTGQRLREALAERVKQLRLVRMLKKRGLDVATYLHGAPIHEIELNIRTCEGCNKITECDDTLSKPVNSKGKLTFCPNDAALTRLQVTGSPEKLTEKLNQPQIITRGP